MSIETTIFDKSGNDVSVFEKEYISWSEKLQKKISTFIRNNPHRYPLVNTEVIDRWIEWLTSQDTKYDIIMWLKAKAYTYDTESQKDKMTLSEMKNSLGIVDKIDKESITKFNNGKKRLNSNYIDKILKTPMPLFYYIVYANSPSDANPFSRKITDISLMGLQSLYKELICSSTTFLNFIKNKDMNDCQNIVNYYYLENAYGFCYKFLIADYLSQDLKTTSSIYKPDFIRQIKSSVLVGLFKSNSFDIELPEYYAKLKPNDFHSFISFLSKAEMDLLVEAFNYMEEKLPSEFSENNSNSKSLPDPGYILMYLLYGKCICKAILNKIPIDSNNKDTIQLLLSAPSIPLGATYYLTQNVQNTIDWVLSKFQLSLPGDTKLTDDEKRLLCGIKEVEQEIPVNNIEFKDAPHYERKVKGMLYNSETEESVPLDQFTFTDDEIPIDIDMPSETHILNLLKKHCEEANENKKNNVSIANLSGGESRTFKRILLKIINNCFNIPTRAKYNSEDPDKSYILRELDVKNHQAEEMYKSRKEIIGFLAGKKIVFLPSLRIKLVKSIMSDNNNPYQIHVLWCEILEFCLSDLYGQLVGKTYFSDYATYKEYIAKIYNQEVLEHISKFLSNYSISDKTNLLDSTLQNRIARL